MTAEVHSKKGHGEMKKLGGSPRPKRGPDRDCLRELVMSLLSQGRCDMDDLRNRILFLGNLPNHPSVLSAPSPKPEI